MACTLNWYSDRGFEMDLDAEDDEVSLRMVAIPIPTDGTAELRAGPVELDRLEILFKAQVEVQGEPGQLQDARVQLIEHEGQAHLELSAKVEDVETGELIQFHTKEPVKIPSGAPERGGPRPMPADEDELDWEDETTLEQMVVNAPETTSRADREDDEEIEEERPRPAAGGLKALLDALANLGEGEEAELGAAEEEPPGPVEAPAGRIEDQTFTKEEEAAGLLKLMIERDALELEDEHELEELVPGVVRILSRQSGPEGKATALSTWLLDQPAVADLYVGDEELAEILEHW